MITFARGYAQQHGGKDVRTLKGPRAMHWVRCLSGHCRIIASPKSLRDNEQLELVREAVPYGCS